MVGGLRVRFWGGSPPRVCGLDLPLLRACAALGVAETGALKTLFEKLKSDLCNEAHQVITLHASSDLDHAEFEISRLQHEIMAESIRMDVIEPVHRVIEEYREVSAVVSRRKHVCLVGSVSVAIICSQVDRVQVSLNDLRAGYEKCVSAYHKYTLQLRECRGMRTAAGLEPPIPFVLDLRKGEAYNACCSGAFCTGVLRCFCWKCLVVG